MMKLMTKALSLATLLLANGVQAGEYNPPRMPDGRPDFQGVWTNASLTPMARTREFDSLVIPSEKIEAITYNSYYNSRAREDIKPTDPETGAPTDGDTQKGYNNFWIDPGTTYGKINGEYRSSWVVEPKNGQIPYSEEARKRRLARYQPERYFSGPESLALGDRCLISFGSSAGPPMNNVMYNNHYQFVQTHDQVVILVEMNHDARIIDINGIHNPSPVKEWFGSSVGKWEGDTLVVETKNVHPIQANDGGIPLSDQGQVIERFTRISDNELLYEFAVTDPINYTQPWRGEMVFKRDDERIFEYACHEGNYAMEGILRGARVKEKQAQPGAKKK